MEKQLCDSKSSCGVNPSTTLSQNMSSIIEAAVQDIDNYVEQFQKSVYKDGWPENKWQEEIEKHPFFMTKPPDPSEELPPLIEGLQKLKYDEDENSPDELANTYKDDGNFNFKCKNYRDAITNFSAGLKLKCSDELKAQLLNNRAAANFFIENYRSALNDSLDALKLDSNYSKAKLRVARCCYHLEKYEECMKICEEILLKDKNNSVIIQLKKDAATNKKIKDRDARKKSSVMKKKSVEERSLLEAIKNRKIRVKLRGCNELMSLDLDPNPHIPEKMNRVYLENGKLFWPVIFSYPELVLNIPINDFEETCKFEDLLRIVFIESEESDTKKYQPENVNIYFKDQYMRPVKFSVSSTLSKILSDHRFVLDYGIPVFFILYKNSITENDFINCE